MNDNDISKNPVMKKRFSIWKYILMVMVFAIISGLPGIIFSKGVFSKGLSLTVMNRYVYWYLFYWVIVVTIVSAIGIYTRYKNYEIPLQKLSQAANKVAGGDFSVSLKPVHKKEKYDYLDQLFDNFNEMVKELGSTETLRTDFISNVSHEFKSPLAIIKSYVSELNNNELSQEQREQRIKVVDQATNNMTNLVTDILRLSQLSNQSRNKHIVSFDLSDQLTEITLSFEPQWSKKDIELSADLFDSYDIYSDQEMLSIVWNNLISNAIKFCNQDGKINISQKVVNNGVCISIEDNGIGIRPEMIKRIFDQFYQGDTSHAGDGNGLGLAMVKKIIDILHGKIFVKSKLNEGTKISVWLPKSEEIN